MNLWIVVNGNEFAFQIRILILYRLQNDGAGTLVWYSEAVPSGHIS